MAVIRKKELAAMAPIQVVAKLSEVRTELYRELGLVKSGGRAQNPGRIGELKRTIARLCTLIAKNSNVKNITLAAKKAEETKSGPAKVGAVEVKKSA